MKLSNRPEAARAGLHLLSPGGQAILSRRGFEAQGVVFAACITNESAGELGLAVGGRAVAVVKASDVMVGTEG